MLAFRWFWRYVLLIQLEMHVRKMRIVNGNKLWTFLVFLIFSFMGADRSYLKIIFFDHQNHVIPFANHSQSQRVLTSNKKNKHWTNLNAHICWMSYCVSNMFIASWILWCIFGTVLASYFFIILCLFFYPKTVQVIPLSLPVSHLAWA